ncbi:MAG: FAD-dependent oxidoreductase [Phycisphaerae bacterium]|nr:FAD-dependent oxidoreductase [Phycisphaerae bacterium]NUQ45255.1 FAD-dependent oxidoreductase [Phycisphaerae bacterium]
MANPSVVVLGGGLSGVAAAYTLARAGRTDVTIIERGAGLGGLAGSFEKEGRFYPLGYHHILHRDRTLLFFLDLIGALPDVRWRKIRMFFRHNRGLFDLGSPGGFLRFPMPLSDKLRFVRLMLRAFNKSDWSDWHDRSAVDLIDAWGGPGVRRMIFEPLTRLKFDLPCEDVSGAWLGARLHFREGSAALGYIPRANWTKVLCDGVTRLVEKAGVRVCLRASVTKLHARDDRLCEAELADGRRVGGDLFVSTIPTEIYCGLRPDDATPDLAGIRYTALISVVCATRQRVEPDFYWMNLPSLDRAACGVFLLSSLNPTIGAPGDACVNFVTHVQRRDRPFFLQGDDELMAGYLTDFREIFGFELTPFWTNVARVPMYSPIFFRGYRNPPVRSATFRNLYFAGNYRTFPSIASTGTALASGLEAGEAMLADAGGRTDLPACVSRFRVRRWPKG